MMYVKWSDIFTYSYLDGSGPSFSFGSSDKFFLRLKHYAKHFEQQVEIYLIKMPN